MAAIPLPGESPKGNLALSCYTTFYGGRLVTAVWEEKNPPFCLANESGGGVECWLTNRAGATPEDIRRVSPSWWRPAPRSTRTLDITFATPWRRPKAEATFQAQRGLGILRAGGPALHNEQGAREEQGDCIVLQAAGRPRPLVEARARVRLVQGRGGVAGEVLEGRPDLGGGGVRRGAMEREMAEGSGRPRRRRPERQDPPPSRSAVTLLAGEGQEGASVGGVGVFTDRQGEGRVSGGGGDLGIFSGRDRVAEPGGGLAGLRPRGAAKVQDLCSVPRTSWRPLVRAGRPRFSEEGVVRRGRRVPGPRLCPGAFVPGREEREAPLSEFCDRDGAAGRAPQQESQDSADVLARALSPALGRST